MPLDAPHPMGELQRFDKYVRLERQIIVAQPNTLGIKEIVMDVVTSALHKIGLEKPTWATVIVASSQDVDIPQAILWETWSRLEDWRLWSKPLHSASRWIGTPGWAVGAKFEQDLNLGFPLGKTTSAETVGALVPGTSVMWWKDEKGIKSCHIWEFEPLNEGRTRITNVEVFHGTAMGLIKPLVAKNWQRLFEQSVGGLVRRARKTV